MLEEKKYIRRLKMLEKNQLLRNVGHKSQAVIDNRGGGEEFACRESQRKDNIKD